MVVVNNPNNWHWTDKNCITWAREYFQERLTGLNTGDAQDKLYSEINNVTSIDGDCEVNQRKGKVISLFDLNMVLSIKGHVDSDSFEGSISVPEVAFDSERDDYQFEISIYKETSKLNEIKPKIREVLVPQLRDVFAQFGKDLLIENGNDILTSKDKVNSKYTQANQELSFASKTADTKKTVPVTKGSSSTPGPSGTSTSTSSFSNGGGNMASMHLEPAFNVPAIELYKTFLEKQRIMAWSRSVLIYPEGEKGSSSGELSIGEKFELFGGNVTSELIEKSEGVKLACFQLEVE